MLIHRIEKYETSSEKQMLQEYVKDLKEFRKKQEEVERELKIAKEFISQNYLSDYEKFRSKTA